MAYNLGMVGAEATATVRAEAMKKTYANELDRLIAPYIQAVCNALEPKEGPDEEPVFYAGTLNGIEFEMDFRETNEIRASVNGEVVYRRAWASGEERTLVCRPGGWVRDAVAAGRLLTIKDEDADVQKALEAAVRRAESFAPLLNLTAPSHR